jgi:hypothetical protein
VIESAATTWPLTRNVAVVPCSRTSRRSAAGSGTCA